MNGRVYDYNVGRFMGVDPYIQGVGNSQGINPYSYVMNNPLGFTDPSGYCRAETGTRIKKCVDVEVTDSTSGETRTKSLNVKHSNFSEHAMNHISATLGNGAVISGISAEMSDGKSFDLLSQKSVNALDAGKSLDDKFNSENEKDTLDKVEGVSVTGRRGGIPESVEGPKKVVSVKNYTEEEDSTVSITVMLPINPKPAAGGELPSLPKMRLPSMPLGPDLKIDWIPIKIEVGDRVVYDVTETTYSWNVESVFYSQGLDRNIRYVETKYETEVLRVPISVEKVREYTPGKVVGSNDIPWKIGPNLPTPKEGY